MLWRQSREGHKSRRDETVEIVNGVIWEGFTEKMTFELMLEGGVKVRRVTVCRKSLPDRGNSKSTTFFPENLPSTCLPLAWAVFPLRRLVSKCLSLSCLKLSTALGTKHEFLTMAYNVLFNPSPLQTHLSFFSLVHWPLQSILLPGL